MGGDLQPGRLADRPVAGIENRLENSLDAAKKVASQKNLGSKVQKALDNCGAKDKREHQYN
eukprot:784234-Pelagomonas_calceolata.AAC.1